MAFLYRPTGIALSIATVALMGCGVGSVSTGDDDDDTGVIGQECEATLDVAGTFAPDGTGLAEDGSCEPLGTWSVTASVADQGTCGEVSIIGEYEFVVTVDQDGYLITYTEDPEGLFNFAKITIEGPCQGNFEVYTPDGMELTHLRPYVEPGETTLQGTGTYQLFDEDQLIEP